MPLIQKNKWYCIISSCLLFLGACSSNKKEEAPVLFEVLESKTTGLDFTNKLTNKPDFNMLKYMYFYNGAGLGAGDFNNDGLIDLFFASNQSQNKIYLSKGNLQFEDVTKEALIPDDGGWSTGVSVADINDDGLLDIYICRVGNYGPLQSKNQLLICQGISKSGVPYYEDQAKNYGLDFSGFSTQAAFLDYDNDGDLDMYLLNHSLRYSSTFADRSSYKETIDSLSGDRFYRNDGSRFNDVSREAGIQQTIIGYGLGIAISDVNLDGYPDIYIGNDFHENDYLYINNTKGGFKDELSERIMHTSQFSMGVDIADINNDAHPEIISADMLPSDPYILKQSLGEDEYDVFSLKISKGYNHQYAHNALQLNRGNGLFSETGFYSGIYATDWSWATLWMDFDNDGNKDLFVSNGIPKRLNDIDYINHISNQEIQEKIRSNKLMEKDINLIEKFPQIKLPNRFFKNNGQAAFSDVGTNIKGSLETYSNGAIYADLDNDGDLDIVVNNIDEPALVYQNKINDEKSARSTKLILKGPVGNRNAVGAKAIVFSGEQIMFSEKFPVHGFLSAMEIPMQISVGTMKVDSAFLIWPDNTFQTIKIHTDSLQLYCTYTEGLDGFDYSMLTKNKKSESSNIFLDVTASTGLSLLHRENTFVDFDREPLIPFMFSTEGPALAKGDFNSDGHEDIFIGSSKWQKSSIFTQQPNGAFIKSSQPALDFDSTYEDVDAIWVDVNKDSFLDLIVVSGGNEFYGINDNLKPRVYINDGNNKLVKKPDAFSNVLLTASTVVADDFNNDGNVDLFIGARVVPWEYGKIPDSYLLQNDGAGKFTDVTTTLADGLKNMGFVKDAQWSDIDNDGDKDLVLALEWDGIAVFVNNKGKFSKQYITLNKGWWNFLLPFDIDNDGDIDFIAGNQGLNSRLKASVSDPVKMYYYDFDGNGKKEQIVTFSQNGKEYLFANKADLEKQMPFLKKKFLYAEDFAKASLKEIFGASKLNDATIFSANYFSNAVLINNGGLNFTVQALPWQLQLTPLKAAAILHANSDQLPDILIGGNFYSNNVQLGRYDADFGSLLINAGGGKFKYEALDQTPIKGEVRNIQKVTLLNKQEIFIMARNNDSLVVLSKKKQ